MIRPIRSLNAEDYPQALATMIRARQEAQKAWDSEPRKPGEGKANDLETHGPQLMGAYPERFRAPGDGLALYSDGFLTDGKQAMFVSLVDG